MSPVAEDFEGPFGGMQSIHQGLSRDNDIQCDDGHPGVEMVRQ